jgi:hypothetical protein
MASVEATRRDGCVAWGAAARTADAKQTRRIREMAMGPDEPSRRLAAQAGGMGRQTRCDFVHRFNEDGVALLAGLGLAPGR